jgi:hypothetical protein
MGSDLGSIVRGGRFPRRASVYPFGAWTLSPMAIRVRMESAIRRSRRGMTSGDQVEARKSRLDATIRRIVRELPACIVLKEMCATRNIHVIE